MCVFEPKTRPLGERFAEFNFDSKILLTCGVGYRTKLRLVCKMMWEFLKSRFYEQILKL
nr:hypothetical protein [Leptospira interrogans]